MLLFSRLVLLALTLALTITSLPERLGELAGSAKSSRTASFNRHRRGQDSTGTLFKEGSSSCFPARPAKFVQSFQRQRQHRPSQMGTPTRGAKPKSCLDRTAFYCPQLQDRCPSVSWRCEIESLSWQYRGQTLSRRACNWGGHIYMYI